MPPSVPPIQQSWHKVKRPRLNQPQQQLGNQMDLQLPPLPPQPPVLQRRPRTGQQQKQQQQIDLMAHQTLSQQQTQGGGGGRRQQALGRRGSPQRRTVAEAAGGGQGQQVPRPRRSPSPGNRRRQASPLRQQGPVLASLENDINDLVRQIHHQVRSIIQDLSH